MFGEGKQQKKRKTGDIDADHKAREELIVELSDRSAWRIWPADMADTLQWLPTTEISIRKIDDETCSHALINESDGSVCG